MLYVFIVILLRGAALLPCPAAYVNKYIPIIGRSQAFSLIIFINFLQVKPSKGFGAKIVL